jgi:hypothetical protein
VLDGKGCHVWPLAEVQGAEPAGQAGRSSRNCQGAGGMALRFAFKGATEKNVGRGGRSRALSVGPHTPLTFCPVPLLQYIFFRYGKTVDEEAGSVYRQPQPHAYATAPPGSTVGYDTQSIHYGAPPPQPPVYYGGSVPPTAGYTGQAPTGYYTTQVRGEGLVGGVCV